MDSITFNKPKSVILHNAGSEPVLVTYAPGGRIHPGNRITQAEDFDDPLDAIKRAKELGVALSDTSQFWPAGKLLNPIGEMSFIDAPEQVEDWSADGTYAKNAVVNHNGKTWLHISDAQGEPDDVYDAKAGTGDWIPLP